MWARTRDLSSLLCLSLAWTVGLDTRFFMFLSLVKALSHLHIVSPLPTAAPSLSITSTCFSSFLSFSFSPSTERAAGRGRGTGGEAGAAMGHWLCSRLGNGAVNAGCGAGHHRRWMRQSESWGRTTKRRRACTGAGGVSYEGRREGHSPRCPLPQSSCGGEKATTLQRLLPASSCAIAGRGGNSALGACAFLILESSRKYYAVHAGLEGRLTEFIEPEVNRWLHEKEVNI